MYWQLVSTVQSVIKAIIPAREKLKLQLRGMSKETLDLIEQRGRACQGARDACYRAESNFEKIDVSLRMAAIASLRVLDKRSPFTAMQINCSTKRTQNAVGFRSFHLVNYNGLTTARGGAGQCPRS